MVYRSRVPLTKKYKLKHKRRKKLGFYGTRFNNLKRRLFKRKNSQHRVNNLGKLFLIGVSLLILAGVFVAISISNYLQEVSTDLPSPEAPFGKKSAATEILDRNGKLLYRVFGDDDRDLVKLSEVPELLKWTFLAAEDLQFYHHQGIDLTSIMRCGLIILSENSIKCGASTITQQLIKKTVLTDAKDLERKVKEMILALKIEQERNKNEILEMYLNTVPEGSNVYGVKRAAKFYFGKELSELNLAEMSILAAIPQDPSILSPTKSLNPTLGQIKLAERQRYVLNQLQQNLEFINREYQQATGTGEYLLTEDMIAQARIFEISYQDPVFQIKAPHFVFYLLKLLQERGYNNGAAFTLEQIETEGLRIYSTLDLEYQTVAEEQVKLGVDTYGRRFGGRNASLIAMDPKNGEIKALVGSYDYFGNPAPGNCRVGIDCMFEPQVNVLDTLQSYGSSLKPILYYLAMQEGLISQNTILADVPIKIGEYQPKNYEGGFIGLKTARQMLVDSRNIPAITLVNHIGVERFLRELRRWGYTTLNNPAGYGPSIAVGGADIKLIDHAQAYQVLANNGKMALHEVVLKITDTEGNIIYEHKPSLEQIADPKGIYVINNILNGKNGGPGLSFDGRDIAGKTGTSENQKETLFITYTPEIVVAGWLGNNNNRGMRYGASGFTSARPWVADFVKRLGEKIPKTAFAIPEGIEVIPSGEITINGISIPSFIDPGIIINISDVIPAPLSRRGQRG